MKTYSNKAFIREYFNAISGVKKTPKLLSQFTIDNELVEHIMFFDSVFPKYSLLVDEMTAEENRVIVRGQMLGKHIGDFNGIPPTYREIAFPFVVCYMIENKKIIDHWLAADQSLLMKMLGVLNLEN